MPYCEQCGYKFEDGDKFCGGCGASFTPQELPAEKKSEEITQETTRGLEEQEEIHEKDIESQIARHAQQRIYKPLIYAILIVLVSVFSIHFFMKPFHGKTKIAVKTKKEHGISFFEDFKSYNNGDFIDGKPHWTSSDSYYSKGWHVDDARTFKYIHFHPSPWPGGFKIGSNYATYHANFPGKVNSLKLEVKYSILPNSEMKIYLSGDDKSWVDVTQAIGMVSPTGEGVWKKAYADISTYIHEAGITDDVYVKFTGAAYSGSGWGAHIAEVKVTASYTKH